MSKKIILQYIKIGLVVCLLVYTGLFIGKNYLCQCIEKDISPELVGEAQVGDKQSQRRIIRMRLRQENIKETSDNVMMAIGVIIVILFIAMFVGQTQRSVRKSKMYGRLRKSLKL